MTSGGGWEKELRHRLHGVFRSEAAEGLDGVEAAVRAAVTARAG